MCYSGTHRLKRWALVGRPSGTENAHETSLDFLRAKSAAPAVWSSRPGCTWQAARLQHKRGMTLVEVLMSMLVMGIGVLGVIALLPLAFVRAVQATNLTNGTILRYNAESMTDTNPRLLLFWQGQTTYSNATPIAGGGNGDFVDIPGYPLVAFQCTMSGTSGSLRPAWNPTVGGTTTDGSVVWTTMSLAANPQLAPVRFVMDPLGWNASGPSLQTNLGSTAAGAVDPLAIPRLTAEAPRCWPRSCRLICRIVGSNKARAGHILYDRYARAPELPAR